MYIIENFNEMKKTLVYHIYLQDDIDTNLGYKINAECLKYYIDVFDKVKFVMVMDDMSNVALRNKGIEFANSIGFNKETDIYFRQNTELGECATVRDFVVNYEKDCDEYVFFGHTKGITYFGDKTPNVSKQSMFIWMLVSYFYNLNFIKEVNDVFTGKGFPVKAFYGALLMRFQKKSEDEKLIPLMIPKFHYSGSFYWVNKPYLFKIANKINLDKVTFNYRYDTEFLPGYLFDPYGGEGLWTHNNIFFNLKGMIGAFYSLPYKGWEVFIEAMGNAEEFKEFCEEIGNKVGFKIDKNM